MKHLSFYLTLVMLIASAQAEAQISGGQHVFRFLHLSPSARVTALGGAQIAVRDDDVALAALNPAALNPNMAGEITLQHNLYLADIQHGYAATAWHLPQLGFTIHAGMQYMGYGDIPMTDVFGNQIGQVKASESALAVGGAKMLSNRVSLGLNARYAMSVLDIYRSNALSADVGILYADTSSRFTAGAVWRNLGTQMSPYSDKNEALLSDLQVGISQKLAHLPFRLSIIAHRLNQWNLQYNDPAQQSIDTPFLPGSTGAVGRNPGIDNFFQHLIFNGEFLLGRSEGFRIRFGYNHLRKRALSVDGFRNLSGFSLGVGMNTRRLRLDAGFGAYHFAGGVFHMGIGTNLKEIF
jgi:hypothetical protein